MGHPRLELTLLLTFLIFAGPKAHVGAGKESPTMPPLPLALRNCLSPLSRQQELYYSKLFKRAGSQAMNEHVLYEFCTSARLLCSASLQESTWGLQYAVGAKTASLSFDPEALFAKPSHATAASLPSTFENGMGLHRTDNRNTALFQKQTSKTAEPVASASKTEVGGRDQTDADPWRDEDGDEARVSSIAAQRRGAKQYFREKDLMVGAQLVLPSFLYQPTSKDDIYADTKPAFLPSSIALDLPPFDLKNLTDLLEFFHIPYDTQMAKKMEETLKACTGAVFEGEFWKKKDGKVKDGDSSIISSSCATSIEALIKFVCSMLGAPATKVQAVTNSEVVGREGETVTILRTMELAAGLNTVNCHELVFPFKVMGCHKIKESKAMVVRVAEEGGKDMDLLVACHKNTTLFNPQHEAFSQLQSSPGRTEICHFLPNSDIMWIPL